MRGECRAAFIQVGDVVDIFGRDVTVEVKSHGHADSHGAKRVILSGKDQQGQSVAHIAKRSDMIKLRERANTRSR